MSSNLNMPSTDPLGGLPKVPQPHLQRAVLSQILQESSSRVILLHAPAGYGKTTIMASLARASGVQIAWVSLYGRSIAFSDLLQRIGYVIDPSVELWDEVAVEALLMQQRTKLWIMLDDFPRAVDRDFDSAVGRLLALHANNIQWWISSRRRPLCNVPRLLLQGDLLEVSVALLRFTLDEVVEFRLLSKHQSVKAQEVFDSTQGWCAAVAFNFMSGVNSDALLVEYLRHEVFDRLSPEARSWLLTLVHFSAFDEGLCSYIFGEYSSRSIIEVLSDGGAFVETSSAGPNWKQVSPVAAEIFRKINTPSELRTCHRLACQYFIQCGELRLAIDQAVLAEQFEVAASLLESFTEAQLLNEQAISKVISYRERLPSDLLESTPRLVMIFSFTFAIASRPERAINCLDAIAKFLPTPDAVEQKRLLACCQAILGVAAHNTGDSLKSRQYCLEALDNLTFVDWPFQLACWSTLIQQQLFCGELVEADANIKSAMKVAQYTGNVVAESAIQLYQALNFESHGDLNSALQVIERQLLLLDSSLAARSAIRSRLVVRQAYINFRLGNLKLSREQFADGYQLGLSNADSISFHGLVGLANLALLDGHPIQATDLLGQAERWLRDNGVAESVYRSILDQSQAAIFIESGEFIKAQSLLEEIIKRHGEPNFLVQAFEKADFLYETRRLLARVELKLGLYESADQRLVLISNEAKALGFLIAYCDSEILRAELALVRGDESLAESLIVKSIEKCLVLDYRLPLEYLQRNLPKLFRLAVAKNSGGLLSNREIEVLRCIEEGLSNQEIADRMYISLYTVKSHVQRLSLKLEVKRRTQAVSKAKSLGLL
ncbi:MAG: hypothetical protein CUR33_07420 [Pseudomonas sp.]|uniref:LuxR C-terminal-related transcriptional regulator n=1 Tax=Pseudomonas sp. FEMGT703P TaxID=2080764 RepID=UPI000CBA04C2|nr:LuxR C-terminal-related transcriptional regulator [Pseudomonas sp. FEMGT703P]PJE43121.1 MAG: hypothetical protein CUR33_07420 [Pseudomonas sp.] [Pseudomonas sp. FEMGT703P]